MSPIGSDPRPSAPTERPAPAQAGPRPPLLQLPLAFGGTLATSFALLALLFRRELAPAFGLPLALAAAALIVLGGAVGALLAHRGARAAAELGASLTRVAAGASPAELRVPPGLGALARSGIPLAMELREGAAVLTKLSAGDLAVPAGAPTNTPCQRAAAELRAHLEALAAGMRALARGEALEASALRFGDLGAAFEELRSSFRAVAEQASTISRGDLRRDVDVPGELGGALQRMTGDLRTMVGRTQVVASSVGDIVVSLQGTSSQLSSATTEQLAAVTETANTMTEMAQTSALSADRAAELIKQGEAAAAVVEDGAHAAEAAVSAMTTICGSLDKAAQATSSLGEKVRRIDSIIETVTFLADQSSTLAINAAIEAARAGEAGKGFAVVAREVRSLAADSRKAATQVRELLGEVGSATHEVEGSVGTSFSNVEQGAQLVTRLGEVVGQLGVTVHDAVGLMRQVEGSARQHQAGVSQVSQALNNLQRATESNRDAAQLLNDLSAQAHELAIGLAKAAGSYTLGERATAAAVAAPAPAA